MGTGIGLFAGARLPEKIKKIIFMGLGLSTIAIGAQMALNTANLFLVVGSVIVGGIVGQIIGIEEWLEQIGERLKNKVGSSSSTFVLGFVTASLLFCTGPMTIVGSLEDGFAQKADLIYIKSLLDGAAAIALTASLGIGVIFSALTVFIVQGILTGLGAIMGNFISEIVLNEISAAGGLLILGIGFNMLTDARIPVGNFIPALGVIAITSWLLI
ncbi:MAG: DUF554 domain-containing protein [Candidatus Zixiibacteriota bacterium]|nr:MAG: DUF554 domain-containing protein [candidate division Zixibacteria bacterium]